MKSPGLSIILLIFFFSSNVEAQENELQTTESGANVSNTFRPSIAVVIGILSIMFSFTCLLLIYAKICYRPPADLFNGTNEQQLGILRSRRFSGIDKTLIESLPFFRFSSLQGSKEGLECSVCLSKFEDAEILRLLPKCKHAFHISCVDKWLENHSSCPLCRYKVEINDLAMFTYSNSLRRDGSDLREDPNVELFVQREADSRDGSSRFSIGSSFRKPDKCKKEELLIPEGSGDPQFLDKFKHRIIISDVVFKNRWSDVNSSDLMFLNSEMLNVKSSQRFAASDLENSKSQRFMLSAKSSQKFADLNSENTENSEERMRFAVDSITGYNSYFTNDRSMTIREEMEKKIALESKASTMNKTASNSVLGLPSTSTSEANSRNEYREYMLPSGKRSMSEIANLPRFVEFGDRSRIIGSSSMGINSAKEENVRRLWLPIARRTVMRLAGRDGRLNPQEEARQVSNV